MAEYIFQDGKIKSKSNVEIYYQSWEVKKAKAILIYVHGWGEYSEQYLNLVNLLKNKAMSVYGIDLRGHGKSDGKRGDVEFFDDYIYDLKLFINLIRDKNDDIPLILFGHDLGAVIVNRYALLYQEDLTALIMSAPIYKYANFKRNFFDVMLSFFSKMFPAISVRNPFLPEKYNQSQNSIQDPYQHNKITGRFYSNLNLFRDNCVDRSAEIRIPLLVIRGENDKLLDIDILEKVFNLISSKNKKMEVIPEIDHKIIGEISASKEKIFLVVTRWIIDLLNEDEKKKSAKKARKTKKAKKNKKVNSKKSTNQKKKSKSVKKVKKNKKVNSKKSTNQKKKSKSARKTKKAKKNKKVNSKKSTNQKKKSKSVKKVKKNKKVNSKKSTNQKKKSKSARKTKKVKKNTKKKSLKKTKNKIKK